MTNIKKYVSNLLAIVVISIAFYKGLQFYNVRFFEYLIYWVIILGTISLLWMLIHKIIKGVWTLTEGEKNLNHKRQVEAAKSLPDFMNYVAKKALIVVGVTGVALIIFMFILYLYAKNKGL